MGDECVCADAASPTAFGEVWVIPVRDFVNQIKEAEALYISEWWHLNANFRKIETIFFRFFGL